MSIPANTRLRQVRELQIGEDETCRLEIREPLSANMSETLTRLEFSVG